MGTNRKSAYKPGKPLLIWDRDCAFCQYWVIKWRNLTGDNVEYKPYEDVLEDIDDISVHEFQQEVKLIDPQGNVYSGSGAAYKALSYGNRWNNLYTMYTHSDIFRTISDSVYRFVARHRPEFYRISVILFGKNPARPKKYWLIYLTFVIGIIILFACL